MFFHCWNIFLTSSASIVFHSSPGGWNPSCSVLTFCRHQIENRKRLTALNWLCNDLRGMASQHINAWSELEQISLTLRDGISPWYSPQPTSTRCRTKVWKKKKMNWSFDSCCKMFVCNFCENSCSLSGQDNVKSVFSSASFTETRNCQHIFEITEDFFYFVIFTPRKKETWHVLEVSHDRSLGVWCKGICKYDQSFRQEWSVTISRDLMFRGFQGFWCEHLADLCGTVRLRPADDVA